MHYEWRASAEYGARRKSTPGSVLAAAESSDAAHDHDGAEPVTKLKGSISEGSNHSNFSDQSSVKILSE